MGNSNRHPRGPVVTLGILTVLVLVALLVHVMVGGSENYLPWAVVAEIFRGHLTDTQATTINTVVWAIRLPRALECVCVGGILGLVGSAFQAQLRNPLAEPYIVGVSSGAAIGGAIAMILGWDIWFGGLGSAALGFVTGMISLGIVYGLASRRGVVEVTTLLLAGVVVGSLMSSLLSLCLLLAGQDTNKVLQWLLGNMGTAQFGKDGVLFAVLVIGSVILVRQTRLLNAFAMGEEAASRMGVDVGRLRTIVLVVGTAMTATAVGAVGIVGFLGLVAPHISRRVLGVDWRYSLIGSGLIGSALLLAADLLAQRVGTLFGTVVGDIPVGIVTAVIGAPSLLILIRKRG
ncbi:MAG: iron ABC transporter permease [Fimbriimonas sp.]|nr:iron ABC transporter permease [Fimbriimonas sp.]